MTIGDYKCIENETFYLAGQFKTSKTYSYQIINTTDIIAIFVKYIRKHVIPSEVDSDESVLFPSWKGTPLVQGEASKKVSNIFRRYGYNLTITRLRSIISTHIEERFRQAEITEEEYHRFITTGQTHNITTHKKYYVKKRKHEEAQLLQESYHKIFPEAPVIHDHYDETTTPSTSVFVDQEIFQELESIDTNLPPSPTDHSTLTTTTTTTTTTNPVILSHRINRSHHHVDEVRKFGSSRSDINETKKKYDWIEEEISYLVKYIQFIAPELPGASKNKYATCLNHLKLSAPAEAIQYFHPHHLMSSDRLKNGYLRALQILEEGEEEYV